jgi:tripartite-type tricarboxylate transporter receptor subunit TctC
MRAPHAKLEGSAMLHRRTVLGLLAGGAVALATGARAAWSPQRPVTIVVPYPPGGSVDGVARVLARELERALGQPVLVENQGGASGAAATRRVAKAEPDGHTLVLGTNQTHATNLALLKDGGGYDPVRDFLPVAGVADLQHALVVRKDLPAGNVAELVALARRDPGRLNAGSTGPGSGSHLALELFKTRTGTDLVHVPYRGGAPLLQDLLGGRIDVSFATVPSVLGQVQAGALKVLAVASPNRSPQLPDAPLLSSAGVTGGDADAWIGLFLPAGAPAEARDRIAEAILAALARDETRAAVEKLGAVANPRGPEALAAFVREEVGRWADVVRAANVQVEP